MLVVTRHRPDDIASFLAVVRDAFDAMQGRPGFVTARLGRSTDEAGAFLVAVEWRDAGSYRRSVSPVDVRARVLPMYNSALDEPAVYEVAYGMDADATVTERASDLAVALDSPDEVGHRE